MKHAVGSILVQRHQDFEIVISDNASDDDYKGYIDSLSDRRIVYYRQSSPVPVTENWKKALSLATGDYVLMLGDDDALVPQFSEIVIPHLLESGPDLIYVAAYHYCYPGVLPDTPAGYFATVKSEFLRGDPGEFCLHRPYARELAAAVLDFRHRFNYNAQHFVLKRAFLGEFDRLGSIYQSPYPDFFAAVLIFYRARSIVVLPRYSVIIGISPKSFGAYYFSLRQKEGYRFLDNEAIHPGVKDFVGRVVWPGDMNNTNWLISAEMARKALMPSPLPAVNVDRYHAIQLISLLRDKYWHEKPLDDDIADLRARLSTVERITFDFLKAALELTASRDKNLIIPMLQAVEAQVGQYANDYYSMLDIGPHKSIADALTWLRGGVPARNKSEGWPMRNSEGPSKKLRRFGGNIIRRVFPDNAGRIISILKRGPTGIWRGVARRIGRVVLGGAPRGSASPVAHAPWELPDLRIVVKRGAEQCVLTPGLFDDFDFRHGDELTVLPLDQAASLIRTPEGDVHIRAADGKGIRVPAKMEFAECKGYQMPEHLVRLTGAGSETFGPLGEAHLANYRKYVGIEPGMSFLEIGSGMGRDAFQLLDVLGSAGQYIGIDVQRESIVWCQKNITRDHPNFRFFHFDAIHELHNPYGAKTTVDFPLPASDRSIDRVALQSVLTHIFEDEVVHYLSEISRVLKPDGLAYVTFLLYSEEIVTASRKNNLTRYGLRFEHKYADGCYVDNAQYPTGGVAYTDAAMQRMIRHAGLRLVRPYLKGQWSGYYANPDDDGQDVAILAPAVALSGG